MLTARTDIPYMMHTIPHLVRMSNFPFTEVVLAIDTAPLSGDKVMRPGIGTISQLRDYCNKLINDGVVNRVVDFNYSQAYREKVYQKHFGSAIRNTHNYKGYPILGTIFHIELTQSEYMLHYDNDMLLYQKPDYSWIDEGVKLMQEHPEIIAVRPLTGPPMKDGTFYQQTPDGTNQTRGFYKFKFLSSRVYLINRKRFDKLLPLRILWRSYRRKYMNYLPLGMKTLLNNITGKGKLGSWEVMVSNKLETTEYVRAVMDSPNAWTIHPKDRSQEFFGALPKIIEKIELGEYPPEQAGHYDLELKYWL
ncbi:MAG: hypothetical protein WBA93_09090 [Microcoleaceae cyanobacterium]